MKRDWIITRISRNWLDKDGKFPLRVTGVNLNHADSSRYGETERYFIWRVSDVMDERYDIGHAVIDDDVPLVLLQDCRRNG